MNKKLETKIEKVRQLIILSGRGDEHWGGYSYLSRLDDLINCISVSNRRTSIEYQMKSINAIIKAIQVNKSPDDANSIIYNQ